MGALVVPSIILQNTCLVLCRAVPNGTALVGVLVQGDGADWCAGAGSWDNTIGMWNSKTGNCVGTLSGHYAEVTPNDSNHSGSLELFLFILLFSLILPIKCQFHSHTAVISLQKDYSVDAAALNYCAEAYTQSAT